MADLTATLVAAASAGTLSLRLEAVTTRTNDINQQRFGTFYHPLVVV